MLFLRNTESLGHMLLYISYSSLAIYQAMPLMAALAQHGNSPFYRGGQEECFIKCLPAYLHTKPALLANKKTACVLFGFQQCLAGI